MLYFTQSQMIINNHDRTFGFPSDPNCTLQGLETKRVGCALLRYANFVLNVHQHFLDKAFFLQDFIQEKKHTIHEKYIKS